MKINPNPTFTSEVKLSTPGEEALASIEVTWKHKDRDALKEWSVRPLRVEAGKGFTLVAIESEYLAEVIASWNGPVDEAGVAVPFSVGALAKVLQGRPMAGQELYQQYLAAMTESRLKN